MLKLNHKMKKREFNYDEEFMGIRTTKPKTYRLSFEEDYRLRSLVKTITPKGKLLDAGCGGECLPKIFLIIIQR